MKQPTPEQVDIYLEKAESIRNHTMFSSCASSAKLAVAEWLANQDGYTLYSSIASKPEDEAKKACGLK